MSDDPKVIEENERALAILWEKRQKSSRRRQKGREVIDLDDLVKLQASIKDESSNFISIFDTIPFTSDITLKSPESNSLEYRLKNVEEKLEWLLENKITEKSDDIIDIIKDEFSSLQFVKEIYEKRTSSGYDLVIVHNEERNNLALNAITKTKLNLKKKLPNVYLELTVLRSSDFDKKEWESRKIMLHRD